MVILQYQAVGCVAHSSPAETRFLAEQPGIEHLPSPLGRDSEIEPTAVGSKSLHQPGEKQRKRPHGTSGIVCGYILGMSHMAT